MKMVGGIRAPRLLGGRAPGPQGPDLDGGKTLDFDIIFFEILRIVFLPISRPAP